MTPAELIKARRNLLGLTQEKLADRIGMKRLQLLKIEKGYNAPTLKTLYRIAEGLGVSVNELIPARKD